MTEMDDGGGGGVDADDTGWGVITMIMWTFY